MPSLFSFSGRLGRVAYIVGTLALTVGTAILLAVGMVLMIALISGSGSRSSAGATALLSLPLMIVFGLLFVASQLSLQVRRLRDIGWDPWVFIGGWIAVCFLDTMLAYAVPAMALRHHHGTVVGALCNVAAVGALWFWPGSEGDESPGSPARLTGFDRPDSGAEPARAVTVATVTGPRTGFGRRRASRAFGVN